MYKTCWIALSLLCLFFFHWTSCQKTICSSSLDCLNQKICQFGQCVACTQDTECPKNQKCSSNGGCISTEKQVENNMERQLETISEQDASNPKEKTKEEYIPTQCFQDSDCLSEQICVENQCQCKSPCQEKEKRCNNGKLQECIQSTIGCRIWSEERICSGNKVCSKGECTFSCKSHSDCFYKSLCANDACQTCTQEACKLGETLCEENVAKVCIEKNGCLVWEQKTCSGQEKCNAGKCSLPCSQNTDCSIGTLCLNSFCVACQNECLPIEKQCKGQKIQTCERINGCYLWKENDCPTNNACLEGICFPVCQTDSDCQGNSTCTSNLCQSCTSCNPNDVKCDGNRFLQCQEQAGCFSWKVQGCQENETCNQNQCRQVCKMDSDCPTSKRCVSNLCEDCADECKAKETSCDGNQKKICELRNQCFSWKKQDCGLNGVCSDGECFLSCETQSDCWERYECKEKKCVPQQN